MHTWVVSTCWLLRIVLLWTFMYVQGFVWVALFRSLGVYGMEYRNGMEFLGHGRILCLTFWGIATPLFTVTKPFYIPTSHIQEFQCLHIFYNRGPQPAGCGLVLGRGWGTGPHSRRWAAGERAKLHLLPHPWHYHWNHPPSPRPWKNCLPQNRSLVPKRLGTAVL